MIDVEGRKLGALLLRRLASGRITNDEWDEAFPSSGDAGLRAVEDFGWSLYSDFDTYRLVGRHALSPELRLIVARCVLFLHSGREYAWPERPRLLPALGWLLSLGMRRSQNDVAFEAWQLEIDWQVWPFESSADLAAAVRRPPFFTAA